MIHRHDTKPVHIGSIQVGGNDCIIIQSMTNTATKNTTATINQIIALEKVGCDLVRVAVLDMEDALAIRTIKTQIHIPIVADIHFDYRLALAACEAGVDKIRINPGNIGSDEHVKLLVDSCHRNRIPIRIGINSGSLEPSILAKYGHPTAEAMVESAQYHVSLLENFGFTDIVISLKSTDFNETIKANSLAASKFGYPLHLGFTEAGTNYGGAIKSALGLGILLRDGIGSTIRVSLSADPVEEIRVAKTILAELGFIKRARLISCPTCGRTQYDMIPIATEIEQFLETIPKPITVAIMGCVVNGPGEAKEANIALCGGTHEALLYVDGIKLKKVLETDIVPVLKQAIIDYHT
ncbi:MAG: flavodoxin-dependent (E)-4-hydroxy-3-methylbut-2-enyl-diphosphate synthase [Candidatus Izemoplasmatales bacterium]|nr:flavodoxin-dependent (E)-4-hydroxy-3-methylbut-2-enyl-diphosphate synthase [Candidatus Izemoplasmatales bacterium]